MNYIVVCFFFFKKTKGIYWHMYLGSLATAGLRDSDDIRMLSLCVSTVCVSLLGSIISSYRETVSRCQGRFTLLASPHNTWTGKILGKNSDWPNMVPHTSLNHPYAQGHEEQ